MSEGRELSLPGTLSSVSSDSSGNRGRRPSINLLGNRVITGIKVANVFNRYLEESYKPLIRYRVYSDVDNLENIVKMLLDKGEPLLENKNGGEGDVNESSIYIHEGDETHGSVDDTHKFYISFNDNHTLYILYNSRLTDRLKDDITYTHVQLNPDSQVIVGGSDTGVPDTDAPNTGGKFKEEYVKLTDDSLDHLVVFHGSNRTQPHVDEDSLSSNNDNDNEQNITNERIAIYHEKHSIREKFHDVDEDVDESIKKLHDDTHESNKGACMDATMFVMEALYETLSSSRGMKRARLLMINSLIRNRSTFYEQYQSIKGTMPVSTQATQLADIEHGASSRIAYSTIYFRINDETYINDVLNDVGNGRDTYTETEFKQIISNVYTFDLEQDFAGITTGTENLDVSGGDIDKRSEAWFQANSGDRGFITQQQVNDWFEAERNGAWESSIPSDAYRIIREFSQGEDVDLSNLEGLLYTTETVSELKITENAEGVNQMREVINLTYGDSVSGLYLPGLGPTDVVKTDVLTNDQVVIAYLELYKMDSNTFSGLIQNNNVYIDESLPPGTTFETIGNGELSSQLDEKRDIITSIFDRLDDTGEAGETAVTVKSIANENHSEFHMTENDFLNIFINEPDKGDIDSAVQEAFTDIISDTPNERIILGQTNTLDYVPVASQFDSQLESIGADVSPVSSYVSGFTPETFFDAKSIGVFGTKLIEVTEFIDVILTYYMFLNALTQEVLQAVKSDLRLNSIKSEQSFSIKGANVYFHLHENIRVRSPKSRSRRILKDVLNQPRGLFRIDFTKKTDGNYELSSSFQRELKLCLMHMRSKGIFDDIIKNLYKKFGEFGEFGELGVTNSRQHLTKKMLTNLSKNVHFICSIERNQRSEANISVNLCKSVSVPYNDMDDKYVVNVYDETINNTGRTKKKYDESEIIIKGQASNVRRKYHYWNVLVVLLLTFTLLSAFSAGFVGMAIIPINFLTIYLFLSQIRDTILSGTDLKYGLATDIEKDLPLVYEFKRLNIRRSFSGGRIRGKFNKLRRNNRDIDSDIYSLSETPTIVGLNLEFPISERELNNYSKSLYAMKNLAEIMYRTRCTYNQQTDIWGIDNIDIQKILNGFTVKTNTGTKSFEICVRRCIYYPLFMKLLDRGVDDVLNPGVDVLNIAGYFKLREKDDPIQSLKSLLSDNGDNMEKPGSALTQLNDLKRELDTGILTEITDKIYENFESVGKSFNILKLGKTAGALGVRSSRKPRFIEEIFDQLDGEPLAIFQGLVLVNGNERYKALSNIDLSSKDTIRLFMGDKKGERGQTGEGGQTGELEVTSLIENEEPVGSEETVVGDGSGETLFRKVDGDFIEKSVKQMIQITVINIINKLIECVKFFIYMKSYISANNSRLNVNDNLYKSLGSLLDQYRYPDGIIDDSDTTGAINKFLAATKVPKFYTQFKRTMVGNLDDPKKGRLSKIPYITVNYLGKILHIPKKAFTKVAFLIPNLFTDIYASYKLSKGIETRFYLMQQLIMFYGQIIDSIKASVEKGTSGTDDLKIKLLKVKDGDEDVSPEGEDVSPEDARSLFEQLDIVNREIKRITGASTTNIQAGVKGLDGISTKIKELTNFSGETGGDMARTVPILIVDAVDTIIKFVPFATAIKKRELNLHNVWPGVVSLIVDTACILISTLITITVLVGVALYISANMVGVALYIPAHPMKSPKKLVSGGKNLWEAVGDACSIVSGGWRKHVVRKDLQDALNILKRSPGQASRQSLRTPIQGGYSSTLNEPLLGGSTSDTSDTSDTANVEDTIKSLKESVVKSINQAVEGCNSKMDGTSMVLPPGMNLLTKGFFKFIGELFQKLCSENIKFPQGEGGNDTNNLFNALDTLIAKFIGKFKQMKNKVMGEKSGGYSSSRDSGKTNVRTKRRKLYRKNKKTRGGNKFLNIFNKGRSKVLEPAISTSYSDINDVIFSYNTHMAPIYGNIVNNLGNINKLSELINKCKDIEFRLGLTTASHEFTDEEQNSGQTRELNPVPISPRPQTPTRIPPQRIPQPRQPIGRRTSNPPPEKSARRLKKRSGDVYPLVGGSGTTLEPVSGTSEPTSVPTPKKTTEPPTFKYNLQTIATFFSNILRGCHKSDSSEQTVKTRGIIYKGITMIAKVLNFSKKVKGGYYVPSKKSKVGDKRVNKTVNKRRRVKKQRTYRKEYKKVRNIAIKTHKKKVNKMKIKQNKATKRKRRYSK